MLAPLGARATISGMPPVIETVTPSAGTFGTQVSLRGSGFLPEENTILWNFGTLDHVPSPDGRTLMFPMSVQPTCFHNEQGSPPLCVLPMISITYPWDVSIRVRTPFGTSNAVVFTLTNEPTLRPGSTEKEKEQSAPGDDSPTPSSGSSAVSSSENKPVSDVGSELEPPRGLQVRSAQHTTFPARVQQLLARVPALFHVAFGRLPTALEKTYWSGRISRREKRTAPALLGALQYYRVHGLTMPEHRFAPGR